ncbi:unnamed protein product [Arabidopsis halleri]
MCMYLLHHSLPFPIASEPCCMDITIYTRGKVSKLPMWDKITFVIFKL